LYASQSWNRDILGSHRNIIGFVRCQEHGLSDHVKSVSVVVVQMILDIILDTEGVKATQNTATQRLTWIAPTSTGMVTQCHISRACIDLTLAHPLTAVVTADSVETSLVCTRIAVVFAQSSGLDLSFVHRTIE